MSAERAPQMQQFAIDRTYDIMEQYYVAHVNSMDVFQAIFQIPKAYGVDPLLSCAFSVGLYDAFVAEHIKAYLHSIKTHHQPLPPPEELDKYTRRLTNSHTDSEETKLRRFIIESHLNPSSGAAEVIETAIQIGRDLLPFFLEYEPPDADELYTLFSRLQAAQELVPDAEKVLMNSIGNTLFKNIQRNQEGQT